MDVGQHELLISQINILLEVLRMKVRSEEYYPCMKFIRKTTNSTLWQYSQNQCEMGVEKKLVTGGPDRTERNQAQKGERCDCQQAGVNVCSMYIVIETGLCQTCLLFSVGDLPFVNVTSTVNPK